MSFRKLGYPDQLCRRRERRRRRRRRTGQILVVWWVGMYVIYLYSRHMLQPHPVHHHYIYLHVHLTADALPSPYLLAGCTRFVFVLKCKLIWIPVRYKNWISFFFLKIRKIFELEIINSIKLF